MINADMRFYDYFTLGEANEYGVPSKSEDVKGQVKMAINVTSQSVQDNVNYKECNYIGLTHANVDDTYIINFEGELLKVLYINPKGRYKQVFLATYGN